MARVQYGSQITALSGSIGGITFHKNLANNIARLRPSIPFVSTPKQFAKQSIFGYLVNKYTELSLANKQAWNTFAAAHTKVNFWGEEKTLSGYNWFMALNYWKYYLTSATFTAPPAYESPEAVPSFTFNLISNSMYFTFEYGWYSTSYKVVFCSPLLRSPALSDRKNLRHIHTHSGDILTLGVKSYWQTYFGITYPPAVDVNKFYIIGGFISVRPTSFIPSSAVLAVAEYTP